MSVEREITETAAAALDIHRVRPRTFARATMTPAGALHIYTPSGSITSDTVMEIRR